MEQEGSYLQACGNAFDSVLCQNSNILAKNSEKKRTIYPF